MKRITAIFALLLGVMTAAFAASQPAWYNDVTAITNNGQYYIYSPNGSGFMEAGNGSVITATLTKTPSLFTITNPSEGKTYSGSSYVSSYQLGTCGPVGNSSTNGSDIIWTSMSNHAYWNIHGKYSFLGTKYAALYYKNGDYAATADVGGSKKTQTDAEYKWYLVSQDQYARHWLIYNYDVLKESINLPSYETTVNHDIYSALATAMTPTFDVQSSTTAAVQTAYDNLVAAKAEADAYPALYNTALSAFTTARTTAQSYLQSEVPTAIYTLLHAYDALTPNVVNTSVDELNTATTNLNAAITKAEDTKTVYATCLAQITALEGVTDMGDGDISAITTDITNARTAINAATTSAEVTAAVAGLRQIDNVSALTTAFQALQTLTNVAQSASGLTLTYTSTDLSTVNAALKAVKAGTCVIEAATAGNATYYPFMRRVTVTISKIDPVVSIKASNITYPATVHTSTLTNTGTSGQATWLVADETRKPGTYTGLAVHFTPANTDVYNEVDATTTLTILAPTTYGTATGGCCPGSTYYYPANGQTYPVGGPYTVTLSKRNYLGGDSIVTLTVTQYTAYPDNHQYVTICHGQTFLWNCDQLTTTGTYTFTGWTSHGCDSIVTLHLTVLPAITNTESKTIAVGWHETWRDFDLSTYSVGSHVLTDTLTSSLGCDSVLILNLTVIPKGEDTYGFDSAYVCPGDTVEYMGEKMVTPGAYTFTMPNSSYGDSIITFYVRNYPVYSKKSNRVLHQGTNYKWRGRQLSGYDEGSYVIWDSLKSVHGCDSLFYLTLTILAPETQYEDVYYSVCPGDTLLYKDVQYTDSGLYNILVPEQSQYRGDSIVRLHLAFYETYLHKSRRIIYEGQNYRWRGRELGTYPVGDFWEYDTLPTIHGCDSIFRLHLTVNEVPTTYRYDTAYLCDGATIRYYHDTLISTTGDYTFHTTNYLGGDSILKLHVETHQSFRAERYDTIMQGDVINWRGRALYLRPYDHYIADTFTSIYGCDSIYCLYVHVNPREYKIVEEMEVCQNSSRTWRGMPLQTDVVGFFPEVLTKPYASSFEADSIYVLNLTVNPSPVQHIYMTWREGHQKTWYQEHFSNLSPGVYTFTSGRLLHTVQGCDSMEVLHLQVLPTTYGVEEANLCPGEKFTYYGKTYTNEGTYTITIDNTICGQDTVVMDEGDTIFFPNAHKAHGDSIITLYVYHRQNYDLHPEKYAQYGDVFWWKGQRYVLEVGTFIFRDSTQSIYGCDSITTMTVIVDRARQTITWNPDTLSVHASDSLLLHATASSGLPVTFASSSLFYAYVNEGGWLIGRVEGKATITATQNGDQNYYSAPPVQYTFDILEPLPYDALPAVSDDPSTLSAPVKLLRDGRLYILTPDGHLYDALGNEIE